MTNLFEQNKSTQTECLTRPVLSRSFQEPAADAEPCNMSFDPKGTYYRCAFGSLVRFFLADIPRNIPKPENTSNNFSDSENVLGT